MKYKSISFNRQLSNYLLSLRDSWRIILLLCMFISGLIIGSFSIKNNDALMFEQLEEIIKSAIIKKESISFLNSFTDTLITNMLFLIVAFALGLCAVGIPAISLIPMIKGFSMGITGAYIYLNYSVKGVCYCLTVLFPAQIIISSILIFACNESFYMSADLFSTLNNRNVLKEKNLIGKYLTRFALLSVFIIISSLIDASLTKLFSSFFAFV